MSGRSCGGASEVTSSRDFAIRPATRYSDARSVRVAIFDAEELHGRLLKALHASGSTDATLAELMNAVDEASDLGRSEREDIAWAAARFWRRTADGS